jgi:hypothetical protein
MNATRCTTSAKIESSSYTIELAAPERTTPAVHQVAESVVGQFPRIRLERPKVTAM